jgi:hypothetical protein
VCCENHGGAAERQPAGNPVAVSLARRQTLSLAAPRIATSAIYTLYFPHSSRRSRVYPVT